jgi:hypothetical protein
LIRELRQFREKAAPCRGHDFQVKIRGPTAKKPCKDWVKAGWHKKSGIAKAKIVRRQHRFGCRCGLPAAPPEREAFGKGVNPSLDRFVEPCEGVKTMLLDGPSRSQFQPEEELVPIAHAKALRISHDIAGGREGSERP